MEKTGPLGVKMDYKDSSKGCVISCLVMQWDDFLIFFGGEIDGLSLCCFKNAMQTEDSCKTAPRDLVNRLVIGEYQVEEFKTRWQATSRVFLQRIRKQIEDQQGR